MDDDQAAADVLRFQITAQFDGCGDAGVFAAVDAGSDQQCRPVALSINNGDRNMGGSAGNREEST